MGKSNLFHFETPRPFAKIIGIGDGTSVLNDIKSEYGKNINTIKYEKDNYDISSTEERLTIIIIDEINVNLSEILNAIPHTSKLFLIMSPCEITLPRYTDGVLVANKSEITDGIRAILDMIFLPNMISLDFYDICYILKDCKRFKVISIKQKGEKPLKRAILKIEKQYSLDLYAQIIVSIVVNPEKVSSITMEDMSSLSELFCTLQPEISILWGIICDDKADTDTIRIDIISTVKN